MMTTYFSLRKAIPKEWTDELKNDPKTYEVELPTHMNWLLNAEKGTVNIRKIFNEDNTEILKGQSKWEAEFENDMLNWDFIYNLSTLCKQNARTKYIMYIYIYICLYHDWQNSRLLIGQLAHDMKLCWELPSIHLSESYINLPVFLY